jgi:hypothetical protein
MSSLIQSDRWRDGGSISAVVLDGTQHRSFWLQTNSWDHPRQAGHEHLFVSGGDNPEAKENRIEISSVEEQRWLDYLVRVNDTDATLESKDQFQKMIGVLQRRNDNSK